MTLEKLEYTKADVELIYLDDVDIITASQPEDDNNMDEDGWTTV